MKTKNHKGFLSLRRAVAFMLAMLTLTSSLFFMSACDRTVDPNEESSSKDDETRKPETPKTELTVYTDSVTYSFFSSLTSNYNSYNSKYVFNVVMLDDSDKIDGKLNRELSAGTGPDLVVVSDKTNLDLPSLIKNGSLADIAQLIQNTPKTSLSLDKFDGDALDAGKFDGKQLLVPFFYTLPILTGVSEYLADAGVKLDGGFAEFCDSLENYNGKVFRYMPSLSSLYLSLGYDFIELDSGKCELDNDKMKELVGAYVKLYGELITDPSKYEVVDSGVDDFNAVGLEGEDFLLLNSELWGEESNVSAVYSVIRELSRKYLTGDVLALPGSDENGISATLGWSIAISSSCKDTAAALNYIDYLTEYSMTQYWCYCGIPSYEAYNRNVREKAYGDEVMFPENVYIDDFYSELGSNIPTEFLDKYYSIFDAKNRCTYLDLNVRNYLDGIATQVLRDGTSVEQAIKNAETYISQYFARKQ